MLCRHSCRSPRAAPAASLHIQTQRCLSRQPPQLSEHSCGSKFSAWKKIDRGLSTSIPHSPWQNVWFSMGASFVFCFIHQAAEIQLTHITLSVTPYKLQQDNAQSQSEILNIFRCAEPVRGLLKKKKKPLKNSLQFCESRKCVRGRKVHVINVFHYNYYARCFKKKNCNKHKVP